MRNRLDHLFQEWHRLGGAVLLAEVDPGVSARSPEEIIAESTAHCRESGRLTWVVLDWLIRCVEELDVQALLKHTTEYGDFSVLGVLCDAAHQRRPQPEFERIMDASAPGPDLVPFFHRVARSPLAARIARDDGVAVFRRWNYLCSELRYLEDEVGRPAQAALIVPPASPSR